MAGREKNERGLHLFFFVLVALQLIVVCSLRLLPFVDLPFHLAAAAIVRYFDGPQSRFSDYFTLNTGLHPNILHLLFCSLPVFPSVEFANKLLYGVYLILFPLSVLLVVRRFGGDGWYALLAFVLLYHFSVVVGFVGYMI